jgi:CheY-like chemotaxis protein
MPRILFAEDGLTVMALGGALFDVPELEVDAVTDGRKALERLSQWPDAYALVILAYELSEISGPECIAFVRRMFPRLPILVLTDSIADDRLEQLAALGIQRNHVLDKPVSPETLVSRVREVLDAAD